MLIFYFAIILLRSYERKSKVLRGDHEKKYWSDVTPEMMSEEERVGDRWLQHLRSYRSFKLTQFIAKLDSRAPNNKHARFPRDIGSPVQMHIPPQAKDWTVNQSSSEVALGESEKLFSPGSEESTGED